MCCEADYYYDVLREQHRRARKEHVCCACGETIRKGDVYRYSFTFARAEDGAKDYKHCLRCERMLNELLKRLDPGTAIAWRLDCGTAWEETVGDLPDEVASLAFMTPDEQQQRLLTKNVATQKSDSVY